MFDCEARKASIENSSIRSSNDWGSICSGCHTTYKTGVIMVLGESSKTSSHRHGGLWCHFVGKGGTSAPMVLS